MALQILALKKFVKIMHMYTEVQWFHEKIRQNKQKEVKTCFFTEKKNRQIDANYAQRVASKFGINVYPKEN